MNDYQFQQIKCAIIDLLDGPPKHTSRDAIKNVIKRLTIVLESETEEDVSEIIDDKFFDKITQ